MIQNQANMYYDDILKKIGEFGLYQKRKFAILCLQPVASGLLQLLSIFTLASPSHRCAIPGYNNDTYIPQSDYHEYLINQTIPPSSNCLIRNQTTDVYGNVTSVYLKCNKWVYDTSTFTSTLVTEFDMVCDDAVLRSNAVMFLFLGLLIGYGVFGNLADLTGRKPLMVVSIYTCCISSYLTVWSPNYVFLLVMRFFMGIGMAGQSLTVFIIGVELVGPSKRRYVGMIGNFYWCIGLFMLSLLGYLIRNWRYLQLSVSVYTTILLTFVIFIPESPRWLLTRGYNSRSQAIIKNVAAVNKVEISDDIIKDISVPDKVTNVKYWKIFTSRRLFVRTIVIYFNWFAASITYFGIILNLEFLVGNIYINLLVVSVLEVVCYLVVFLLLDKLGRKYILCICLFMGAASLASTICVIMYAPSNLKWLKTVFALIGQFGVTCVFAILWLWTGELFPTELRNIGTGTSSAVARAASLAAPYFGLISNYLSGPIKDTAPFILYAAVCLIALVLAFSCLPDTSNVRLPETVGDSERVGKSFGHSSSFGDDEQVATELLEKKHIPA